MNGGWEKANADVVHMVAEHLPTPARQALSETSAALRVLTPIDGNVPTRVLQAWSTLRQGTHYQALDALLEHLPKANAQDKAAIVAEFGKHGLIANEAPTLAHLDHLYDELASVSKSDPKATLGLVKNLFGYGLGNLPAGQHGAGLEKITDALQTVSLLHGSIGHVPDFAENKRKLDVLGEVTQTALDKFFLMNPHGLLGPDAPAKIIELTNLNTAAAFAQDFAVVRQADGIKLPNNHAQGVLENINALNTAQAKLMLANNLIAQFDQLQLDNPSEFLANLKAPLQAMEGQEATAAPLIAQINKLQQTQGTSATAS